MPRHQFARETVVYWAKEYPVRFGLWIAAMDATAAGLAYWLSSEVKTDRGLIVAGAIILGVVVALLTLFVVAFLTAPRRDLAIKVADLQETVVQQGTAIEALVQEKWGDPADFLPIYHDLRTDLREAARMIEQAINSGQLWPYSQDPDASEWKKHKAALVASPWVMATQVYGPLNEAFGHIERIKKAQGLRFINRAVKPSDDLDSALVAFYEAEAALTIVIGDGYDQESFPEFE